MHMKNAGSAALILSLVGSTVACISEEEKAARAACALDVAGDYTEVRPEGVEAGALVITNETDKNDVKLEFTRGALYEGEQAFLDRLASEDDKAAIVAALTLGEGDSEIRRELVGGENVSTDFGSSSELEVSATEREALPSVEGALDPKVKYSLALGIENGSDELKGTLTITFSERRPNATDDEEELHIEDMRAEVSFKRPAVLEAEQSEECKEIVDGD